MLQTHPALELIHHGPICQGVQEPQLWLEVHGVIFLGVVQEQGTADYIPHHGEGPIMELPARRVPTCSRPASFAPTCLVTDIFVPTGYIGGLGWGGRHAGWRGWR